MEPCGGHASVCSGYATLKSHRLKEQHLYISNFLVLDMLGTSNGTLLASLIAFFNSWIDKLKSKSATIQEDVKSVPAFDPKSLKDLVGSSGTASRNHWAISSLKSNSEY